MFFCFFSENRKTSFRCQQVVSVFFLCHTVVEEERLLTGEDDSASHCLLQELKSRLHLSENKNCESETPPRRKLSFVSFIDTAAAFLLLNDKVTMKSCSFTSILPDAACRKSEDERMEMWGNEKG